MRLFLLAPLAFSLTCTPIWAQDDSGVTLEVSVEEIAVAEEVPGGDEPASSAADALVATLKDRFNAVADLLAQVQDAETAEALLGEVSARFSALMQTDASALEAADGEELAAEFAAAFAPVDAELARLEEENFYGVDALRTIFVDSEESGETEESGYCFPLGPLDFLRGAEKNHVCPRKANGLHLPDWEDE